MAKYKPVGEDKASSDSEEVRDPFTLLKDHLDLEVYEIQNVLEKWSYKLYNTNTAETKEFSELTNTLKKMRKSSLKMCKKMNNMLSVYNENPDDSLSLVELKKRKLFIQHHETQLAEIKTEMTSKKTQSLVRKHREEIIQKRSGRPSDYWEETEITSAIGDFQKQQLDVREEQDEILSGMIVSLQRLGAMGNTIEIELKEQNKMLEEVDEDMETAQDRLASLTVKLDKLLGQSGKNKICLIIFLVMVLIFLVYFMFD